MVGERLLQFENRHFRVVVYNIRVALRHENLTQPRDLRVVALRVVIDEQLSIIWEKTREICVSNFWQNGIILW